MVNIFFQVSALMHIMVTAIIYFTKQKQKTIENYAFRSLIIFEIATLLVDISSIVLGIYLKSSSLNSIIGKVYLCGVVSWMIMYTYYLYIITHPQNKTRLLMEDNSNSKIFINDMKRIVLFNLVAVILIAVLPLFSNVQDITYTIYGPAEVFSYIIGGTCIIVWGALLFKSRKTTKKQHINLIFSSIMIAVAALCIQALRPDAILVSSIGAFLTTLAYFMLENPDLHFIEELNIATRQAESANHAKSDFLSSMSHEIRTPLNAIVGFSQALAKEDISGAAKEEVKEIINASTNLLETVNGILDISKIEANKIEIVNLDYSTKKMINEIVSQSNARIGSKTIDFKIEIDENLPQVLVGDSFRIKQIVLNLLSNSIKYTKSGYVKLKIDSQSSQNKCLLTIIVEDTGIGLTKEDIDMLFVKFQRFEMDKNVNIAGTGLGMAITKGLVELMNGEIAVESEYGKGSTFTIILEQDISDKKIEEVASEEELQKIEAFNASGQRVLVVDDNKINLKVAEKLLSEYNLDLDLVDSGRECINKVMSGEKYDLILLDIMMPKMKGSEVLKNLKAQVGFKTPVIALTADVISGMEDKYISQGFDDCLPKPIVEEELFYLLKKYLKEVTNVGLRSDSFVSIHTPNKVISPIVKEAVTFDEDFDLPKVLEKKETPKELNTDFTISDDRFELIEKLNANKENPFEYAKVAANIKELAEYCGLKELASIAYENELAGKAFYQEFITDNYDKFINEIISNIEILKNYINKE